ncbi:MAG: putative signal transducing protein [Solirubrobacteraceae bacterium]
MEGDLIVCPSCGRAHPPSERFCETCGMPLVHPTEAEYEASERQRMARKIKPQYTEGPLVKVANAKGQPEAEFIAGLLLEEGIPCLLRNSIGGYSPMIGPREILVPESGAQAAREALAFQRPSP